MNVNSGVQSIEYKIDSNAATVITSSTQIEVPYESKLYVKAVAKTGYSITGEASKTFASITDAQS